jgi:hypothetical protein
LGPPARRSWSAFRSDFAKIWEPGDHVSVLARTKGGKSYLVCHGLLPMWDYTLTLDVKNDGSVPVGGRRLKEYPSWRQLSTSGPHHYRIAPPLAKARSVFDDTFRQVWSAGRDDPAKGSWTLYVDELKILSDKLKLRDHLETMYIAGRSRGITMIGSTQAPRDVPSDVYDQATFFFFGPGMRDIRTLDRLGEISGDRNRLREVVPNLSFERHEFYVLGPDFEAITFLPSRRRKGKA